MELIRPISLPQFNLERFSVLGNFGTQKQCALHFQYQSITDTDA